MDILTETTVALVALLSAALTSVITWKLSKRKNETEADSNIVNGANFAVDAMVDVVAELRGQVANIKTEAELLRSENAELKEQVRRLSEENLRLADEIQRVTVLFLEARCPTCESALRS